MPPTLHPYLKRGLDFDASPADPSDLVEHALAEHHDAQSQTAKRRRVEAIALQYLRGRPPVILTATLKGPFTKEWKNPWASSVKEKPEEQSRATTGQLVGRGKTGSKMSQIASPETSRAVGQAEEQLYSQPDLEPLPATAPLSDEDELTGATEFFSVETEEFIANNSPANPFWLRRPAESFGFPPNSQTDKSPIKPRRHGHTFAAQKSLQLAMPKEALGVRRLPTRATPSEEWRSSASAPMDISSSIHPATTVKNSTPVPDASITTSLTDMPDSSRLRADSAQEEEARSSQAAQHAQTTVAAETPNSLSKDSNIASSGTHLQQPPCAQSFETFVPATTYKVSSTVQVPQSSPTHGVVRVGSQTRASREDMQTSAERPPGLTPTSATRQQPPSSHHKTAKVIDPPKKQRHHLVASPAPASSTGFMYRRLGQPKGEGSNVPKAKPRAVNFSSSPTHKKNNGPSAADPDILTAAVESEKVTHAVSNDAADAVERSIAQTHEVEVEEREEEPQESYRSKQSQYSTQAAMLLAQLEFQEDCSSQSSTSSATLRPWSQPVQNTPPRPLLQPSPAITPLSVFDARTDDSFGELAGDSVLRGPPISTQELFNAASPFAFSTVKKKSQRLRRTSLRFAFTSGLTESASANSPRAYAQRVPLKEKNTSTTRGFSRETSSPKPSSRSPKHTTNDVELPQLDFHTSLDFGPKTDFTDFFLTSLNNEP